jgi:hypothetical protein
VRIIKKMRRQTAVWWQRGAADSYGQFSYASPVEITCRWEDRTVEFIDAIGQRQLSASVVYVDRVMAPGDLLRLGDMESSFTSDPSDLTGVGEVRRMEKTPTLKATKTLLVAYLSPRLWR